MQNGLPLQKSASSQSPLRIEISQFPTNTKENWTRPTGELKY